MPTDAIPLGRTVSLPCYPQRSLSASNPSSHVARGTDSPELTSQMPDARLTLPDRSIDACTSLATHQGAILHAVDALRFYFIAERQPEPVSPSHHNVLTLPRTLTAAHWHPDRPCISNAYPDALTRQNSLVTQERYRRVLSAFLDAEENFGSSSIHEDFIAHQDYSLFSQPLHLLRVRPPLAQPSFNIPREREITLSFLNYSTCSNCGSVHPNTVVIAPSGGWKLIGFEASSNLKDDLSVIYGRLFSVSHASPHNHSLTDHGRPHARRNARRTSNSQETVGLSSMSEFSVSDARNIIGAFLQSSRILTRLSVGDFLGLFLPSAG
ncbi:hypothetical protein BDR04DRAFT_1164550 [Suillus decipiens]|nr:hypothetical protein BDR04DRAFT_1164550 [Suillus decipiens]